MKKGLLYHCLVLSLIFHLAVVLLIALEKPQEQKPREPVAVDLLEPPKLGPSTVLPAQTKKESGPPARMSQRMAMAVPRTVVQEAAPQRSFLPSFPAPREVKPAPAQAKVSPGDLKVPGPAPAPPAAPASPAGQTGAGAPSVARAPSAPSAGSAGTEPSAPPRLKLPTMKDLEQYAKVDEDVKRTKDPNAITLDTEDLNFTSYLHGLKQRIEEGWEYPDIARRDGIQGDLVMQFTIQKSGKVTDVAILKSSGYPMLDEAAKKALFDASPFNPLPDNWKIHNFTITGNFIYRLVGGLDLR
ncbi:MAG: TonB family protein [Nitrospirota bacterium]